MKNFLSRMKREESHLSRLSPKREGCVFLFSLLTKASAQVGSGHFYEGDEKDVFIYLSRLLFDYAKSEYRLSAGSFCFPHPSDMLGHLEKTGSLDERLSLFKANADELLVSLSIFKGKAAKFRCPLRFWGQPSRFYEAEARSYYSEALRVYEQIHCRRTKTAEAFSKLAKDFRKYVSLLEKISADYLNYFEFVS